MTWSAKLARWLSVADAGRAVDFYQSAFGAVEPERLEGDVGVLHDEFTVEVVTDLDWKLVRFRLAAPMDGGRSSLRLRQGWKSCTDDRAPKGPIPFDGPSVVWSSSP